VTSGILLRLGCHACGVARVSAQRGGAFVTKLASSAKYERHPAAPGLSCARCCARVGPEGRGFCDQAGLLGKV
jgi:hypothetical protein